MQGRPPFPPRSKPHMCFSGTPSCSGCAPCDACLQHVRSYVIPVAMAAAGYGADQQRAYAFFDAYTRAGWPRLQEAMLRDPRVQGPLGDPGLLGSYAITDIVSDLQELEMYRTEARSRQASMQTSPSPGSAPWNGNGEVPGPSYGMPNSPMGAMYPGILPGYAPGSMPGPAEGMPTSPYGAPPEPSSFTPLVNPMAPTLNGATPAFASLASSGSAVPQPNQAAPWCLHQPPHAHGAPECPPPSPSPYAPPAAPPDSRPLVQKMDAEDIAAAASSGSSSGQNHVLGNVMHVPPGMEHHLPTDKK